MKKLFFIILAGITFLLTGCFNDKNPLKKEEQALADSINFSREVAADLKRETKEPLIQTPWISESGELLSTKYPGIMSSIKEDQGYNSVLNLKDKFRIEGYLIFILQENNDKHFLTAIKGTDELDILKYRHTRGFNKGLTTNDIILKLETWRKAYGLIILRANSNWVDIQLKTLPKDLDAFVNDVYSFCPDVVDKVSGEKDMIKTGLKNTNGRLYLLWQ